MRSKFPLVATFAALLTLAPFSTARALDLSPALYVGGGIGASWLDPDTAGSGYQISSDQDFAWHLLGGYRINQNFSVEFSYADLGAADVSTSGTAAGDISYRQTTLGVLWSPTMKTEFTWRPYLKVGVNYSDHSWGQGELITDDWGGFAGIGVEKFLGNHDLALRADYTVYAQDAQALSISIVKYFPDW